MAWLRGKANNFKNKPSQNHQPWGHLTSSHPHPDEWLVDPIYRQRGNQTGTRGHVGTYNIYGQRAETIIIYNHICLSCLLSDKGLFLERARHFIWLATAIGRPVALWVRPCLSSHFGFKHTGVKGSTPFRSGLFVVLLWFIHLLLFFFFFSFVFFFSSFCSASSSPPCSSKKCGESKARRSWRD